MCGIAGGIDFSGRPFEAGLLGRMAGAMRHRGPDDEGIARWPMPEDAPSAGASAALVSRRLSIIDVAGGHQPLKNEDGTVWAVVNGEIYNHQALRQQLEKRGHRFTTHSDAEVVVHLYEERQQACVAELDGMFALAVWDARRRQLLLARDRFGKKPLLYARRGSRLLFASEFQSLLQDEAIPRSVCADALGLYFGFLGIPAPWTIYEAVRKLPPAHYLLARDGEIRAQSYWSLAYGPKWTFSESEALKRLDALFDAAVRKRLMSDVPLGVFLSGGVDSSAVVEAVSRLSPAPVRTFSIGFRESGFNELPAARQVAGRFGTRHAECIVDAQSTKLLPLLVSHFGEPFADSSVIPTYHLCRFARESVTVALSGEGGDELFAGYGRHRAEQAAAVLQRLPLLSALAGRLGGEDQPGAHWRRQLWALAASPAQRYRAWVGAVSPQAFARLTAASDGAAVRLLDAQFQKQAGADAVDAMLAVDAAVYLPSDLLVKIDIASMANGLEVRTPLLDCALAEFVARLPGRMKLRGTTAKYLFRRLLQKRLPASTLNRRKQGFAVPVDLWFRTAWRDLAGDVLLASSAAKAGLLNQRAVSEMLQQHWQGRRQAGHGLWALLMIELWYSQWVDAAVAADSPLPQAVESCS